MIGRGNEEKIDMDKRKSTIYSSSAQAFGKMVILSITLGISILASLLDTNSCYITTLVQACNNTYDFWPSTSNLLYDEIVRRESNIVIGMSVISFVVSIIAVLGKYEIMDRIVMKGFNIFLVAAPLLVVYHDYKMNIMKENELRKEHVE